MLIPDDSYTEWHKDKNDIPEKYKSVIAITNEGPLKMYHGHGTKNGEWGWMRGGENTIIYKWMYFPESPSMEDINKHDRNDEMVKKLSTCLSLSLSEK